MKSNGLRTHQYRDENGIDCVGDGNHDDHGEGETLEQGRRVIRV